MSQNQVKAAKLLVKHGADVNLADRFEQVGNPPPLLQPLLLCCIPSHVLHMCPVLLLLCICVSFAPLLLHLLTCSSAPSAPAPTTPVPLLLLLFLCSYCSCSSTPAPTAPAPLLPLIYSCSCSFCLASRPAVCSQCKHVQTPLWFAAFGGEPQFVEFFLASGADANRPAIAEGLAKHRGGFKNKEVRQLLRAALECGVAPESFQIEHNNLWLDNSNDTDIQLLEVATSAEEAQEQPPA